MLVRLKELRKEFSISQQKLANALGISQQSINKYENHNIEPDILTLKLMADYFQTTVDYLIGYSDDPAKPVAPAGALSREEASLLNNYRKLSSEEKSSIMSVIKNYMKYKKDC